jgi:hypothetical protein
VAIKINGINLKFMAAFERVLISMKLDENDDGSFMSESVMVIKCVGRELNHAALWAQLRRSSSSSIKFSAESDILKIQTLRKYRARRIHFINQPSQ